MEKRIKDFEDYAITDDGLVISYKYSQPRVMKTWIQKGGYENIKLCKDNKTYHFLIHRLVAEAFIPNPQNLPEINHKNKQRADNRVQNLEWCDRITNLYDSYSTMPPIRNFIKCSLYNPSNQLIGEFNSIKQAAAEAKKYGASQSSMIKNYTSKGYRLIKESVETNRRNPRGREISTLP